MADPISLPTGIGFENFGLTDHDPKDVSRMIGRRVEVAQFGTPWWSANFGTQFLSPEKFATIDGWLIQAQSADVTFNVYDLLRPRPVAMNNGIPIADDNYTQHIGGANFDGSCNIVSIIDSRTIQIDGLPTVWEFSAGDYIEIKKTNLIKSLHRLVADVSASDGAATLTFRHGLDIVTFTAASTCELEKPSCVMQMVGLPTAPKGWSGRKVSFSAQEVFFQ